MLTPFVHKVFRLATGTAARFGQFPSPVGVVRIHPGQPLEGSLIAEVGVLGARVAELLRDVCEPAVRQPEFRQPVGIVAIQFGQPPEDVQGRGVGR